MPPGDAARIAQCGICPMRRCRCGQSAGRPPSLAHTACMCARHVTPSCGTSCHGRRAGLRSMQLAMRLLPPIYGTATAGSSLPCPCPLLPSLQHATPRHAYAPVHYQQPDVRQHGPARGRDVDAQVLDGLEHAAGQRGGGDGGDDKLVERGSADDAGPAGLSSVMSASMSASMISAAAEPIAMREMLATTLQGHAAGRERHTTLHCISEPIGRASQREHSPVARKILNSARRGVCVSLPCRCIPGNMQARAGVRCARAERIP